MHQCQDVDDLPLIIDGVDHSLALYDALPNPLIVSAGQDLADAR